MIPEQEKLSHEKFSELCALAMSGSLTVSESGELKAHLTVCEQCRDAYEQYIVLTKHGMPMLASRYSRQPEPGSWDDSATRQKLFTKIAATRREAPVGPVQPSDSGFLAPRRAADHPLALAAVAACLIIVASIGAYRFGRRAEAAGKQHVVSDGGRLQKLATEKNAVDDLLGVQTQKLTQLQEESTQKQVEIEKLRSELQMLETRSREATTAKRGSDEQLRAVSHQRDALVAQLQDVQQAYQNVQTELTSLSAERDKAVLRLASLESRVDELSAANQYQEGRIRNQEQYLSSDRDIRELMGARQLYIADVFDVSSDSRTRKPYGRVFYTKGKSLIFYAFDLDRQPGIKNGSAFQAWGKKESDQNRPLNLGVLYMDNEANRRWILRFDDPKQLAEIDAVFVTLEPHGGSLKPTGKPFLYASLRKEANHP